VTTWISRLANIHQLFQSNGAFLELSRLSNTIFTAGNTAGGEAGCQTQNGISAFS
jgi:hypothetical protein